MRGFSTALWLAFVALPGGALAQSPEGFIGLRWGTPLNEIRQHLDLSPVREEGRYAVFELGDFQFDGIDLRGCGLEFLDGRLSGGFCQTVGREDTRRLKRDLERRFGKPLSVKPYTAQWSGADTFADYDEDELGNAYLYAYSRRLNDFTTSER